MDTPECQNPRLSRLKNQVIPVEEPLFVILITSAWVDSHMFELE